MRDYGIFIALVVLAGYFAWNIPEFGTWNNALLILAQVSVVGIIAVGMTFTIITAGIDLSAGSLLALAGIVSALFAQQRPTPLTMTMAFAAPIFVGAIGGAMNGAIIAGAGVSPLIVTLGTLTAYRGLTVWYRVNPVYNLQPFYQVIGQGTVEGIPIPVIVLLVVATAGWITLSCTRFGRHVYAVGGNREAARAAGINVEVVTFGVYVISGLCIGIAALVYTSRLMGALAVAGQGFELQAIAAAVIGGASLFGGRGKVSNTIVGAIIMGILFNGLVMLNVPQPIQQMFVGIIIITAVWLDGWLRKRRA